MAFFSDWFSKAPIDIAASVPLSTDISSVQYPSDNYANFASEGYGRSAVVHACIRELATGVASARFMAQVDTADGTVEVENSPLAQLLKYPNETQDFYSWLERVVTYLYVAGNVYVLKERGRANQITQLYLL